MSWLPPFRKRFDPEKPDKEDISIEDAIERSYNMAAYSLLNDIQAEDVSLQVAKQTYDEWPQKRLSLNPHKSPQNRAFMIDLSTFKAMERYKRRWVEDMHRPLDPETVDVWFLEALVEYIIQHRSMYVAVGIGSVLFDYENTEVQKVLERLDISLLETEAKHKDGDFRKKKVFILEYFKQKKNKYKRCVARFLTIPKREHQNEVKRFDARANSRDSFEFVKGALAHLTPLEPDCPFPHEFYDGVFNLYEKDLELYIQRKDPYKTRYGVDRVRKHALLHPECWMRIYEKLGMESPERKLEMPDYSSNNRVDLASGPTQERSEMKKMSEELRDRIKKRADEWDLDRKNFSAQSIMIRVNDETRRELNLDRRHKISEALTLEDGDNFVEVYGLNEQGDEILLGTHFISWDSHQVGKRPIRYVTELKKGRRVELLVKYQKDEFGDPISAVIDAAYIPSWASSLGQMLSENVSQLSWKKAALLLLAGLGAAFVGRKLTARKLSYVPSRFLVYSTRTCLALLLFSLCLLLIPGHKGKTVQSVSNPAPTTQNQNTSEVASTSDKTDPQATTAPPSTNSNGSSNAAGLGQEREQLFRKAKSAPAHNARSKESPSTVPQNRFDREPAVTEANPPSEAQNRPALPTPAISSNNRSEAPIAAASFPTATVTTPAAVDNSTPTVARSSDLGDGIRSQATTTQTETRIAASVGNSVPAAAASVASAAKPQVKVKIEKGLTIRVRSRYQLSSATSNMNDGFSAVVVAPVRVNGREVISVNSIINGYVSKVERAGQGYEDGVLDIKFNSLRLASNGAIDEKASPIKIKARLYNSQKMERGVFIGDARTGAQIGPLMDRQPSSTTSFGAGTSFSGCAIRAPRRKSAEAEIRPTREFDIILTDSLTLPPRE